jgi:hypothetical protein
MSATAASAASESSASKAIRISFPVRTCADGCVPERAQRGRRSSAPRDRRSRRQRDVDLGEPAHV